MRQRPFFGVWNHASVSVAIIAVGVFATTLETGLSAIEKTVGLPALRPAAQKPKKTIWDGIYTEEQATRGQQIYGDKCVACHVDTLLGDGIAPALVGSAFADRWNEMTVADLFTTVRTAMPQDDPGSLPPQAYADVITYLLKMNSIPAGTTELPADADTLGQLLITEKPSQE